MLVATQQIFAERLYRIPEPTPGCSSRVIYTPGEEYATLIVAADSKEELRLFLDECEENSIAFRFRNDFATTLELALTPDEAAAAFSTARRAWSGEVPLDVRQIAAAAA